jgi:hypothetical protein
MRGEQLSDGACVLTALPDFSHRTIAMQLKPLIIAAIAAIGIAGVADASCKYFAKIDLQTTQSTTGEKSLLDPMLPNIAAPARARRMNLKRLNRFDANPGRMMAITEVARR